MMAMKQPAAVNHLTDEMDGAAGLTLASHRSDTPRSTAY